jgi:hypothetical protein
VFVDVLVVPALIFHMPNNDVFNNLNPRTLLNSIIALIAHSPAEALINQISCNERVQ